MSGCKAGHFCIMVVFPKYLVGIYVDLFCKKFKMKLSENGGGYHEQPESGFCQS